MIRSYKLSVVFFILIWMLMGSCQERFELPENHDKLFLQIPASHSKIDFQNKVVQTRENNHIVNVEFISGGGVAVGDINNDGLPDLFFTGNQVKDRLYLNQGNFEFKDISESAGITPDTLWSSGVTFVDIDADGDQDIYVCRNVYLEDEKSANQLYLNNGDLTFTESARSFGLADQGFSIQSIFFDFDQDGLVDMYLVNQPPSLPGVGGQLDKSMASNRLFSDKLYKNTGDGKFVDITDEAKLRNFAFGLSVSVGDFNNDTWMDIYVTNDFDVPDHVYINQKDGTFADQVYQSTKHISNFSMGSDIADYDNDGNLDLIVVDMVAESHERIKTHMGAMKPEDFWNQVKTGGHYQYMFNTLQRNNGDGTFTNVSQEMGLAEPVTTMGCNFGVLDNDGYLDFYLATGDPSFISIVPNKMYRNKEGKTFEDVTYSGGFGHIQKGHAVGFGDLDMDGDQDIYAVMGGAYEGDIFQNLLFENPIGNKNNWVNIILEGKTSNRSAIGAKIIATIEEEGVTRKVYHTVGTGASFGGNSLMAEMGLGKATSIQSLEIIWPNSARSTSVFSSVAANRVIKISEGTDDIQTLDLGALTFKKQNHEHH